MWIILGGWDTILVAVDRQIFWLGGGGWVGVGECGVGALFDNTHK